MRVSALDCIGRGVANLRANWELVLLQFTQVVACSVLVVVGIVGVGAALGMSLLLRLGEVTDWQQFLGELGGLSPSWGTLVILFAGLLILTTVITLVYCWFQAGLFSTLERGERQAPPLPRVDPQLFRTFEGRSFWGWASAGAWRYFWFVSWAFLVITVVLGVLVLGAVAAGMALVDSMGPAVLAIGCLALLPVALLAMLLNLWMTFGQALLPRERFGVLAASGMAWRILQRRLGASLLFVLVFVLASVALALVFGVLGQGLSMALDGAGALALAVQLLLTMAQWLASSILSIAFFGSAVALVRSELDAQGF